MFLFKGLGSSAGTGSVDSALQYASRRTGVDVDYLKTTAKRESNLNPTAKAGTSSATGLFQFIERTWLGMLKQAGGQHGYGDLAAKIETTPTGNYTVRDAKTREQILELREDPKAAALMAGEYTAQNAESLKAALGRSPSEGELYAAHFLGPRGAVELVRLAETAPNTSAASRFPAAAAANKPIFYAPNGQARTAGEVYQKITSGYDATPAVPENASYLAFAAGRAGEDQVFHGLFRSDSSGLGPIGKSVSGFWSGQGRQSTAYGMTESAASATVETTPGSKDVTIRMETPSRSAAGRAGDDQASAGTRTASASDTSAPRAFGRYGNDPSLAVR